jgi:hypothetical protein
MYWEEEGALCKRFLDLLSPDAHISQVGINYFGQDAELKGCINDVKNIQNFIICELRLETFFADG